MVGYRPDQKLQLSATEYAVAGAVSGAGARVIAQPLDVIKIRFQLQVEPVKKGEISKYWSTRQAVRTILKEEGITGLWKGHVPAQVLSVVYGAAQFAAFELLTKVVWHHLPEEYTTTYRPVTHSICGGVAAMCGMAVSHPTDVLRTRFVAQGKDKTYHSMMTSLASITRTEGMMGLYKGLGPAVLQTGLQMGIQFGLYDAFKKLWNMTSSVLDEESLGVTRSAVCGAGAGFISKILVYPLDVSKKRLEIREVEYIRKDFGSIRKYTGLFHCMSCILKEEGYGGLYKGLVPSVLKSAVVAASLFVMYEQICFAINQWKGY